MPLYIFKTHNHFELNVLPVSLTALHPQVSCRNQKELIIQSIDLNFEKALIKVNFGIDHDCDKR